MNSFEPLPVAQSKEWLVAPSVMAASWVAMTLRELTPARKIAAQAPGAATLVGDRALRTVGRSLRCGGRDLRT